MANKKNQNNATQTTATNNTVSKEEKKMAKATVETKVMTIEEMENFAGENNLVVVDTENENKYELRTSKRAKTAKFIIQIAEEPKAKQVHEAKDRDIKIESGKVGDIGVKMIYHREKDGTKQYRIFLAQKVDGKLKRTRYMTEELKANQKDEKFVKKVYDQIIAGKVKVQVA